MSTDNVEILPENEETNNDGAINEGAASSEAEHVPENAEISDNSNNEASSYSDCYKYSNRTMSYGMEKRRQMFLERQKEKRKEATDKKRDLSELFEETEPMETTCAAKPRKSYKLQVCYKLMLSEWFVDIPFDLEENWVVKLCPDGIRLLVVAQKGITTCYYKNGRQHAAFRSGLPGGHPNSPHTFTVLDCTFSKVLNTMFVFDVLAWNSVSFLDSEAEFRFYWLRQKFAEEPDLCCINRHTDFNFALMDSVPANLCLLQDSLFSVVFIKGQRIAFDGVLFYHKEGTYYFGRSPLVGWLRTFMIRELLRIDVDEYHLRQTPINYRGVWTYLCHLKDKRKPTFNMMEMDYALRG